MTLLYVNPCAACDVKAITSEDGTTGVCQNCGRPVADLEGATVHGSWPPDRTRSPAELIYYLRFGDRIKIGTTRNLPLRLKAIPHDQLLATEPGSFELEHRRHRQLHRSLVAGQREWFHFTDEVRQHIASLATG